jgi:hypothetical protein
MIRTIGLIMLLAVAACVPGYTSAEIVYSEPAQYVYVAPPERVVVVTREVLVSRGWVVDRVEEDGERRIIWARRGPDEIVRIFVTPQGDRVVLRSLREERGRGRHRGWERRGDPDDVIHDIDGRLKEKDRDRDRDH